MAALRIAMRVNGTSSLSRMVSNALLVMRYEIKLAERQRVGLVVPPPELMLQRENHILSYDRFGGVDFA
jgi:hypothetical protein